MLEAAVDFGAVLDDIEVLAVDLDTIDGLVACFGRDSEEAAEIELGEADEENFAETDVVGFAGGVEEEDCVDFAVTGSLAEAEEPNFAVEEGEEGEEDGEVAFAIVALPVALPAALGLLTAPWR